MEYHNLILKMTILLEQKLALSKEKWFTSLGVYSSSWSHSKKGFIAMNEI
jgi:hypothetical protein